MPITLRLIVGKGWGQGQRMHNLYNHYLHIFQDQSIMPSNPNNGKKLLIQSIKIQPSYFIEHRWLHDQKGHVEKVLIVRKLVKLIIDER